ncbi:MAG: hypothetical protein Q8P35_01585 [Candidatus Yanofskybacteria bacterium]|nr:hypothetical protein [Candidatus Yanofskybacteria bacterium]
MMKAIFIKDVRAGDILLLPHRGRMEVARVTNDHCFAATHLNWSLIQLVYTDGTDSLQDGDDTAILVHHPYPEGKTNRDMLGSIAVLAHEVHTLRGYAVGIEATRSTAPELERAIHNLQGTIEAYELGKPLEEKPRRNESLVDRHMIP